MSAKPNPTKTLSKSQQRKEAARLHNANYEYRSYVKTHESTLDRIKENARLEKEMNDKLEQEGKL